MVYKYNLSISGELFYPNKILKYLQKNILINSYFNPTDKKPINPLEEYGYGSISLWHPKKFSTEDEIKNYENDLIEFLLKHRSYFIDNGANEFEIFVEIYFDGEQCNFEIFNSDLLKKVHEFNLSLPVSVYVLKKNEIKKWEKEIKLFWESD